MIENNTQYTATLKQYQVFRNEIAVLRRMDELSHQQKVMLDVMQAQLKELKQQLMEYAKP